MWHVPREQRPASAFLHAKKAPGQTSCTGEGSTMAIAVKSNRFAEKFGYPDPNGRAVTKVKDYMTAYVQDFIRHAPFMIMATSGEAGHCDASPKGGKPGFVRVLDERHLLVPD